MQETTVVWEPMYEGSRLPWFTKAFVVYLAIVLFASVFRAIRLMWRLRGLRKMEQVAPTPPDLWASIYVGIVLRQNHFTKESIGADPSADPASVRLEHDQNPAGGLNGKGHGSSIPRWCYG